MPVNKSVRYAIYDTWGLLVLAVGSREFTKIDPQGNVKIHELTDSIQLVDGLSWNPAMLSGAHPVMLTCCSTCRNPEASLFFHRDRPTHGLLSVRNARVCVRCGAVTCARHGRRNQKSWRCLKCARTRSIIRAIRPIFFKLERE